MQSRIRPALLGTAGFMAALVISTALTAQSWRTLDAARALRDSTPLAVHVTYGAGHVTVRPEEQRNLYDMHLRYDAERSDPFYHFDAAARQLDVGIRHPAGTRNLHSGELGELRLDLARSVPLRLQVDVGAAEGDYDLSGLRLDELSLKTGATETKVHFDTPNPIRMRSMRMEIGAASLDATGLGNANVERVDVNLGMGSLTMDFGGAWRGDMEMTLNSALGDVTLSVPGDVGIRLESSTFLHELDAPGLVKKDGYWATDNWDTARYKLRLHSSGALGQLTVKRVPR